MSHSLLVGGAAFLVSLLAGMPVLAFLRSRRIGKAISEEGPSTHSVKAGTPTMGGVLIWGTVALVTVPTNLFDRLSILLPLAVLLATLTIGVIDDLGTLEEGRRGGRLTWRLKFALLGALSVAVSLVLFYSLDVSSVNIPWAGQYDIGYAYLPIAVLIVFATTSAVSITDGLDGLLGGTAALAFAAYAVIAFMQGQDFLATFSFTVVGALLGFLWYNAHPAAVFMGDTGALPLGALLATVALMTGHWLLLPDRRRRVRGGGALRPDPDRVLPDHRRAATLPHDAAAPPLRADRLERAAGGAADVAFRHRRSDGRHRTGAVGVIYPCG